MNIQHKTLIFNYHWCTLTSLVVCHYSSSAFIYLHHSLYSRKAVIKKDFVQSSLTGFSELKFICSRFPHILLKIECFLFHSLFFSGKTQKRPNNIIRGREQFNLLLQNFFVGNWQLDFKIQWKLLIVSMHFLDIKKKQKQKQSLEQVICI